MTSAIADTVEDVCAFTFCIDRPIVCMINPHTTRIFEVFY